MSFPSTITVDDASGDDVSYVLISPDASGSRRVDTASTPAAPATMLIRHNVSGKGSDAVDRHNVTFNRVITATPEPVTLVCSFTVAVPRNSAVTSTIVIDQIANLIDFLLAGGLATIADTANLVALLRGED